MTQSGKWRGYGPDDAGPAQRKIIDGLNSRVPQVTITLKIYSQRSGDSAMDVEASPDSAFAIGGAADYSKLIAIGTRELRSGLMALGRQLDT